MEEYVQKWLLNTDRKVSFYKKEGHIVMTENKKKENFKFYPVF